MTNTYEIGCMTNTYTQIFKRQRERQATILSLVARFVVPCAFTPYNVTIDWLRDAMTQARYYSSDT